MGISRDHGDYPVPFLYLAVGRQINLAAPLKSYRGFPEALHAAVSRDAYNLSI